ncbi:MULTISPECIES: hydroxymethylbilane synthase [Micrococcaceae]|uniref:hydroxymethylbilane synthase n=1 Tax=unclassified Kocuria TaxID=2649579 RepID=UPI00101145DA|nr:MULTISPECIES: hydroxymethylbilane synthase [unclassified Kocuria]
MTKVLVGTRASALATTQSQHVADMLVDAGVNAELKTVTTTGDVISGPLAQLGGTGVFAAALRQELLGGAVDVAVHSLKDLPTKDLFDGKLSLIYPPRGDSRDVLVGRDGMTLDELPEGATIGTGSPRRAAQVRALRPDCVVTDIRGNVGTRLSRVRGLEHYASKDKGVGRGTHGDLDAVVLAAAGLARLGLSEVVTEFLDPTRFLPAAGQGCLAVEYRTHETAPQIMAGLAKIDDSQTRIAVLAERSLLFRLEAGCAAPVGAHAQITDGKLRLDAVVAHPSGTETLREHMSAEADDEAAIHLGTKVAELLLERGADRFTELTID